jgi:hypothetical protein
MSQSVTNPAFYFQLCTMYRVQTGSGPIQSPIQWVMPAGRETDP